MPEPTKYTIYSIACPYCSEMSFGRKSLAQEAGWSDQGHGTCPHCNRIMLLKYNKNDDIMSAEEWPDIEGGERWLKRHGRR